MSNIKTIPWSPLRTACSCSGS